MVAIRSNSNNDTGLYCMYGTIDKIPSGTTLILFLDPPMHRQVSAKQTERQAHVYPNPFIHCVQVLVSSYY